MTSVQAPASHRDERQSLPPIAFTVAAPTSRLPFDVLALIVLEVATDGDADAQDLRTLSSISRVWRDVTIHTPQAWSTIVLNFEPLNDLEMPRPDRRFLRTVRDVREWFERSGSCPKDVWLMCGRMPQEDRHELGELLHARRSELRKLYVSGSELELSAILVAPLPRLEALDVHNVMPPASHWTDLVEGAPSLSRVCIGNGNPWSIPLALRAQLRVITQTVAFPNDIIRLVQSSEGSPLLRALSVGGLVLTHGGRDEDIDPVDPNAKSNLQTLSLSSMTYNRRITWMPVFQALKSAGLEVLALQESAPINMHGGQDISRILRCLLVPNPPLRELYLSGGYLLRTEDVTPLLSLMPFLERLVLCRLRKLPSAICDVLSEPVTQANETSGWLCPQLTHFCIVQEFTQKRRVSRASILAVALARFVERTVHEFTNVRLDWASLVRHEEHWGWFEDHESDMLTFRDMNFTAREQPSLFTHSPRRKSSQWWQMGAGFAII